MARVGGGAQGRQGELRVGGMSIKWLGEGRRMEGTYLSNFPSGFPIDFLGKLAGKFANDSHRSVGSATIINMICQVPRS